MKKKEFKITLDYLMGLILLFLILGIAIYVLDKSSESGLSGTLYTGICTFTTGVLAVLGVMHTISSNQDLKSKELLDAEKLKNKELLNELDQKSEWRKELMNIAAKPVMELEDVHRILASLRFLPKSKDEIEGEEIEHQEEQESTNEHQEAQNEEQSNEEGKKVQKGTGNRKDGSDQKEFDVISNYIYKKLNMILNKILLGSITEKTYTQNFLNIPLSIKDSEEIRLYTKFLLKHHWEYNQGEKNKKKFKKKELKEFKNVMEEIHRLNQKDNIKNDYYKINDIYNDIYIGVLNDYAKEIEENSKVK
ncbi:hypothetical protein [Staphylococcus haemolyticus]